MKITLTNKPLPLAVRLILFISITTITVFLLTGWFIKNSVINHFDEQDIIELETMGNLIGKEIDDKKNNYQDIDFELKRLLATHQNNVFFYILDYENHVIHYTPGIRWLDVEKKATAAHTLYKWKEENFYYHILTKKITDNFGNDYKFYGAIPINSRLHFLRKLFQDFLIITLIGSITVLVVACFAVYQGYAPLRKLSKRISNFSTDQLDTRLTKSEYPIELRTLILSFNQMLKRIEDVFHRQSNFSADIAHEMRTPITNLITQTQIVLSQHRNECEYSETLYSNLEEYERIRKMVNDMLFLAQADNNQLLFEFNKLDLQQEWTTIFEFFEAWAEEQKITLTLNGTSPIIFADKSMLRRAFSNLLSNAIRYTLPGNIITVTIDNNIHKQQAIITIKNPSEKITPEHLVHLFDRFYRVDPARQRKTEGAGIGLAIVKSIIELHHGTIHVTSDTEVCFTITLPINPQQII